MIIIVDFFLWKSEPVKKNKEIAKSEGKWFFTFKLRKELNKSVIYFAQKSGKPIMGFTYSVKNAYIASSWDSMVVPYPFAKGVVRATKPLFVPKDITEEEAEKLRKQLEDELNQITLDLDKECGLPEILPGKAKRNRKKR